MKNYKKIATWHAKKRGGKFIQTNKGTYFVKDGEEPELYDSYEDYIKNHKN